MIKTILSLLLIIYSINSKKTALLDRLSPIKTQKNNTRRLTDPLVAGLVVATLSTVSGASLSYSNNAGCSGIYVACDYATIEFRNYFCSYSLQHVEHTTWPNDNNYQITDNPEPIISGGSRGTGGRYYGRYETTGVIRYWIDFTDTKANNWYTIDIFWCSDCEICSGDMDGDEGEEYCNDYDAFGMAIGWEDRYYQDIDTTLDCFKQAFAIKKGLDATLDSECNLNYDTGFDDIYEAGSSGSFHTISKTWDNDGPGLELKALMDQSSASVIDVHVDKLLGTNTVSQCT